MGMMQADFGSVDKLVHFVNNALQVTSASVAVGQGGTGYEVDDILTVQGGECCHPAVLKVTAAPGGVIAAVMVYNAGAYQNAPSNPVSVSGGHGTGAQFNLTTAPAIAGQGFVQRILRKDARWYVEYWV